MIHQSQQAKTIHYRLQYDSNLRCYTGQGWLFWNIVLKLSHNLLSVNRGDRQLSGPASSGRVRQLCSCCLHSCWCHRIQRMEHQLGSVLLFGEGLKPRSSHRSFFCPISWFTLLEMNNRGNVARLWLVRTKYLLLFFLEEMPLEYSCPNYSYCRPGSTEASWSSTGTNFVRSFVSSWYHSPHLTVTKHLQVYTAVILYLLKCYLQ